MNKSFARFLRLPTSRQIFSFLYLIPFLFFSEMTLAQKAAPVTRTMEAGVMLIGQFAADYRGSTYYGARVLPLPYFYYQGPFIKADRGGVRGEFWATERLQLNISVDGALGGENSARNARRGMPDLKTAVEFGPSLDILLSGASFNDGISLRLPIRGVFTLSTDGVDHIGNVINPRLNWRFSTLGKSTRLSMQAGVLFADRHYHDYFYGVDEQYVQSWRPRYRAKAGYSGSYLRANVYRAWGDWRAGVSLRYDNLAGSVFDDSPLMQTDHFGSISFAVIRRLWSN